MINIDCLEIVLSLSTWVRTLSPSCIDLNCPVFFTFSLEAGCSRSSEPTTASSATASTFTASTAATSATSTTKWNFEIQKYLTKSRRFVVFLPEKISFFVFSFL
jgi:hypothetical protein